MALTVVNMILLMVAATGRHSSAEPDLAPPVLRARAIEIVDINRRVRASITTVKMPDGTTGYPETVLCRLTHSKRPVQREDRVGKFLAQLAGTTEGASHIGAVEILAQIHEREEGAENTRFQIIGERQTAGGHAGQVLAMFGDKFHDLALSFLWSIAERGFAAHACTAIFDGEREMQDAQAMLAESRRHFDLASLNFAVCSHGSAKSRA